MAAHPSAKHAALQLVRYRRRRGSPREWPGSRRLDAPAQAAVLVARRLLAPAQVWRLRRADVIARLSGGLALSLSVEADPCINGRAVRLPGVRLAVVTTGAARAAFELCAALWSQRSFMPGLGRMAGLLAAPDPGLGVPRGLEHAAATAGPTHAGADGRLERLPAPAWLVPGLAALDAERRLAFERTVFAALALLFLHEMGHVCLGHLDLAGANGSPAFEEAAGLPAAARPGRDGGRGLPAGALRAFEIEADRYALRALFAHARERDARRPGAAGLTHTQAAVLGATLMPLIFHAQHLFCRVPESAWTHPPLWFRADEIVDAARPTAGAWPAQDLAPADAGIADRMRIDAVLAAVSAAHPLFGQWLGPALEGGRRSAAERVLAEARHARADFLRGHERQRLEIVAARAPGGAQAVRA